MKNAAYETLDTRNVTQDDVILSVNKSVNATVVLVAGESIGAGSLLVTKDGGRTFKKAFIPAYDENKADYKKDEKAVYEGYVYKALVEAPAIKTITDNAKWKKEEKYIVNGAAMITFNREAKENIEFKAAVLIDGELLQSALKEVDSNAVIAAYPAILIKQ